MAAGLLWPVVSCPTSVSPLQVPLRMMESVECRDMFQLHIICKDSKVIRYLAYCCDAAAGAAGWDQLWWLPL